MFYVLKAFEFFRDSHAVKSFNSQSAEGTEKRNLEAGWRPMERNYERA
jgi:hypothetical protein